MLSIIAIFLLSVALSQEETSLPNVSFEANAVGSYTDKQVLRDWQNAPWIRLFDRAHIVQDEKHGKVLRIDYPKGAVGPKQGGGQFEAAVPPSEELWLSYYLKFSADFDFRLGGKLPGLTSGGETFTGGNKPTNGEGWSARFMWTKGGKAVAYLYYVDMKGEWGDGLPLGDFQFAPGRWYKITQHIKLNTDNQANGVIEAWVDGKKLLSQSDIRFRLDGKGLIDILYFSTFHGGNTPEWAPQRDSSAYFDDFVVSATPLNPN